MSKKRKAVSVAALLLSETAACVMDPTPEPPTRVVATQPASATRTTVPFADPTPAPPLRTNVPATATTTVAGSTPGGSARPSPSATRAPTSPATPTRAPVRTVPPPICDPVPPPPARTPTATPTPDVRTETNSWGSPSAASPAGAQDISTPSRDLPLQQRLRLRIVAVPGEEHVYRVEANFAASQVVWMASGGVLEAGDGAVRWLPPQRGGSFLLQAIVDAGPRGVAVAAQVIEL